MRVLIHFRSLVIACSNMDSSIAAHRKSPYSAVVSGRNRGSAPVLLRFVSTYRTCWSCWQMRCLRVIGTCSLAPGCRWSSRSGLGFEGLVSFAHRRLKKGFDLSLMGDLIALEVNFTWCWGSLCFRRILEERCDWMCFGKTGCFARCQAYLSISAGQRLVRDFRIMYFQRLAIQRSHCWNRCLARAN